MGFRAWYEGRKAAEKGALIGGVFLVLATAIPVAYQFTATKRENTRLRADLQDMKEQRDRAELKLAPFQAVANSAFQNAPVKERIDLLIELLQRFGQDLVKVVPYHVSEDERKYVFSFVDALVKEEARSKEAPATIRFITFQGQTIDASDFLDLLRQAFEKAGKKTETWPVVMNLSNDDGSYWNGVEVFIQDSARVPMIANGIRRLFVGLNLCETGKASKDDLTTHGSNVVCVTANRLSEAVLLRQSAPAIH
jgi:hypothetical protein